MSLHFFKAQSFAPAAFFGLLAMAIYGSEAWTIFKKWQVEQFMGGAAADNSDPFSDNFDPFGDKARSQNMQQDLNQAPPPYNTAGRSQNLQQDDTFHDVQLENEVKSKKSGPSLKRESTFDY